MSYCIDTVCKVINKSCFKLALPINCLKNKKLDVCCGLVAHVCVHMCTCVSTSFDWRQRRPPLSTCVRCLEKTYVHITPPKVPSWLRDAARRDGRTGDWTDPTFIMYLDVSQTADLSDGGDRGQTMSWANFATDGRIHTCVNIVIIQDIGRIVKLSDQPFFPAFKKKHFSNKSFQPANLHRGKLQNIVIQSKCWLNHIQKCRRQLNV